MFQSEIFATLDCIKKDTGTLNDHTDIWNTNTTSSTLIVTRTDEYTEFKEATTGNFSNVTGGLQEDCVVEFDYYQVDGGNNTFMQILDENSAQIYSGGINISWLGGTVGNWYHLKFTFQNGVITAQNETTGTTVTRNYTNAPSKFNWWSSNDITAIRFKNFCIYPI